MAITATNWCNKVKFVEEMNLFEAQAELRSYKPGTSNEVVLEPKFVERRAALWGRLDALVRTVKR